CRTEQRELRLGIDVSDVRLCTEGAKERGYEIPVEEGANLRFEALDPALVRVDRSGDLDVEAARVRGRITERAVDDEAAQVAPESCDRCKTGAREIIFQARVVICGLERLQERIAAAATDEAVRPSGIATGKGSEFKG